MLFSARSRRRFCVLAFASLLLTLSFGCGSSSSPSPAVVTFQELQTDISRGGRSVAVSVSAADPQIAIVAGESGGLFRTTDGGSTWQHIDAFAPFRMVDVAFAEPGSTDKQVVIATTLKDAQTAATGNAGGVWRSADSGLSWSHVTLPAGCAPPQNAWGIAFLGSSSVFVGADCGLLSSSDLGLSWTVVLAQGVRSVVARPSATSTLIDVCLVGGGHRRSIDAGATWGTASSGPSCVTAHSIAASPLESNVLFATQGTGLVESDDGGQTWPINLNATAYSERPVWVKTRLAADQDPAHFDLYFPGRRVTCSNAAPRCPSNAREAWARVPASPLNHDINDLAFAPGGNCPRLMVADWGVYRSGNSSPNLPCGADDAWTHVGRASTGLGSLQIYDVTGQLHYPVSASGVSISGYTNLFIGTMDNLLWATHDAGSAGWQGFGTEGSYLQSVYEAPIGPASDLQLTYMEFGGGGRAMKNVPNVQAGTWSSQPTAWTASVPPGNGTAPVLISSHTYVQWSGNSLFLTSDGGATWSRLGVLPTDPADPTNALSINTFGSSQATQTTAGPALYEFVTDAVGRNGLALLTNLSPTATPRLLEVRTFAGVNNRGSSSGLQTIFGNCFAPGAWYCRPVYAADPKDYRNLIAADFGQNAMVTSNDAGQTWHELVGLTNLVTGSGTLSFTDGMGGCQAHVIAYDPGNSSHILVGTDQAGILASADGGLTWRALPGTASATAITSIFFDDRTDSIYVATYGRGLWKLTVDWTTVT
jgi:photosystem II stability/assembly factor-like uncharacterized protein